MPAGRSSGARAPASINSGFQCAVQKWLPHSFKTEQVHLHHCIPSMCGTQWSIFFWYATNHAHTALRQSGCTCTTAYLWGGGHNGQFFLKPQIRLSDRVNKAGAPAPLHTPDVRDTMVNFLLDRKSWQFCPAHRGYAVVQVHGSCLKPVCQKWVSKNGRFCPPPQGYAVVQVHPLCLKVVCTWFVVSNILSCTFRVAVVQVCPLCLTKK